MAAIGFVTYLDVAGFRARTGMPMADVDLVEQQEPGYIYGRLVAGSAKINAQLEKRYPAPFVEPVPEVVLDWLTDIVTIQVYLKRGVNPSDAQFQVFLDASNTAKEEIAKAANSQTGLFELPLVTNAGSAISQGGPLGYSEASPYEWTDRQAEAIYGGG